MLTDGEESVLDLLRQNIERNGLETKAQALSLEWGENVEPIRKALEAGRQIQKISAEKADFYLPRKLVILGSDLVYYPKAIEKLIHTIALLLSTDEDTELKTEAWKCCFIAFTPRWSGWPQEMQASCEKHGLEIQRILHEEALQTSSSQEDGGNGWFANTRFVVVFRKGQQVPAAFVRPENLSTELVEEEETGSSTDFLSIMTEL